MHFYKIQEKFQAPLQPFKIATQNVMTFHSQNFLLSPFNSVTISYILHHNYIKMSWLAGLKPAKVNLLGGVRAKPLSKPQTRVF